MDIPVPIFLFWGRQPFGTASSNDGLGTADGEYTQSRLSGEMFQGCTCWMESTTPGGYTPEI